MNRTGPTQLQAPTMTLSDFGCRRTWTIETSARRNQLRKFVTETPQNVNDLCRVRQIIGDPEFESPSDRRYPVISNGISADDQILNLTGVQQTQNVSEVVRQSHGVHS